MQTKTTIAVNIQGMEMASGLQEPQGFPKHRGFSRGTGVWKHPSEGGLQISGLMGWLIRKGHKSEEIHSP